MTKTQGVRWDLTGFFPSFNGPEMISFKKILKKDIAFLTRLAAANPTLSDKTAPYWEKIVLGLENAEMRQSHLKYYVMALSWTDSSNDEYPAELARISKIDSELSGIQVRLKSSLKNAQEKVFSNFTKREGIAEIAYALSRIRQQALRTMTPPEEQLASDLSVDGFHAWERLYNKISSKLTFEMRWPNGKTEQLPISRWRVLISDPNRAIGKAAFESGTKAWASIEDPCAAALNALAGWRGTLSHRRGTKHFLEDSLFFSGIKKKTLTAMNTAIERNLDQIREIVRVKALTTGKTGISFFEREAPLPLKGAPNYSWEEASAMLGETFSRIYPDLGEYYKEFVSNRRIDSEPRKNKTPGAFCISSRIMKEGRVLVNFNGAMQDIGTLAHEMGHAWHGNLLKNMRWMATKCPPTLSETASVFGEHLLIGGILSSNDATKEQKLLTLDAYLNTVAVFLLDITVRFRFEKAFYEERETGEVPASRLRELMVRTQREVYGETLLPGEEDPLLWVSKLHFYFSSYSFYNYPYTFGFLMARTLYERFTEDGAGFLPKFETFLRLSGTDTVETVVRRSLGENIEKPEFWEKAILGLNKPLAQYKSLLAKAGFTA
jgi:oligoendopeptidase F